LISSLPEHLHGCLNRRLPYLPRQLLVASFQAYLNSLRPADLNTQLLNLPEQLAAIFSFPARLAIKFSLPEQQADQFTAASFSFREEQASAVDLNSSLPADLNTQLLNLPKQLAASISLPEQLAINFILPEQQAATA
jgi:hypothetical protein